MFAPQIMALVLLLVLAGGAMEVARRFRTVKTDPLVARCENRRLLRAYAAALGAYRSDDPRGRWPPDLRTLWHWPGFTAASGLTVTPAQRPIKGVVVRREGTYRCRPLATSDPATVVMVSHRLHASQPDDQGAKGYLLDATLQVQTVHSSVSGFTAP